MIDAVLPFPPTHGIRQFHESMRRNFASVVSNKIMSVTGATLASEHAAESEQADSNLSFCNGGLPVCDCEAF